MNNKSEQASGTTDLMKRLNCHMTPKTELEHFASRLVSKQQQEIASLKAQLEQHDDEIKTIEEVNQELLNLANIRVNELKAIFELSRITMQNIVDDNGCSVQMAKSYLQFTPAQCLASVKADAIDECAQVLFHEGKFDWQGADKIVVYANKLREQK